MSASLSTDPFGSLSDEAKKKLSFLQKLLHILATADTSVVSWADDGHSFVVHDVDAFCDILRGYLRTSNFASFVRQLNYYGFHKLTHARPGGRSAFEFRHEKFLRDAPHLVNDIKRRSAGDPPALDLGDSMKVENEKLRARISSLQYDLSQARQLCEESRKKVSALESENAALKAALTAGNLDALAAKASEAAAAASANKRQRADVDFSALLASVATASIDISNMDAFPVDFGFGYDATPVAAPEVPNFGHTLPRLLPLTRDISDLSMPGLPTPNGLDFDVAGFENLPFEELDLPQSPTIEPVIPHITAPRAAADTASSVGGTASSTSASQGACNRPPAGSSPATNGLDVEAVDGLLKKLKEEELTELFKFMTLSSLRQNWHPEEAKEEERKFSECTKKKHPEIAAAVEAESTASGSSVSADVNMAPAPRNTQRTMSTEASGPSAAVQAAGGETVTGTVSGDAPEPEAAKQSTCKRSKPMCPLLEKAEASEFPKVAKFYTLDASMKLFLSLMTMPTFRHAVCAYLSAYRGPCTSGEGACAGPTGPDASPNAVTSHVPVAGGAGGTAPLSWDHSLTSRPLRAAA